MARIPTIGLRSRPVAASLVLLWTALIWELCTTNVVSIPGRLFVMRWLTNLSHAPLFGMEASLIALTFAPGRVPGPDAEQRATRRAYTAAAVLAIVYGACIEWRQAYVPGRTASVFDVITDTVGAFGVPWALATGALFSGRAVLVFIAGSLAAVAATIHW